MTTEINKTAHPIMWIAGGHMTFPLQVGKLIQRMKRFHGAELPRG